MPRDSDLYLADMLVAAERIRLYTSGLTYPEFRGDIRTVDAVVRNLEVLGETAKQIPEDVRSSHSDIEWRKLAGLRDILIHAYYGIDVEIVWDIVDTKLAPLIDGLSALVKGRGSQESPS